MKLLAVAGLVVGVMFPLITASFATEWITDKPAGALDDFEGTVWEAGIFTSTVNQLGYNNDSNSYELTPAPAGNDVEEAFGILQSIFQILVGVAVAFIALGMLIHSRKPSKFGSFLIFLGSILIIAMVALITLLQTTLLQAIGSGGSISGNTVSVDNSFNQGTTTFTWRFKVTIAYGIGYFGLVVGAVMSFFSLFMKGDYDE